MPSSQARRRQMIRSANEVASAQGLDAVEASVPAPRRAFRVVGDHPGDVVGVHHPREGPMQRLAHGRGTDGSQARSSEGLAVPSHMAHLAHQE